MAFMSGTDEGRMMTTKEFLYLVESRLYFKYSIYQKGVRASGKVREGCRDVVKELGRYLHYIFVTHERGLIYCTMLMKLRSATELS